MDWASDKHDVLVQDAGGGEVLAATFTHDERGLSALGRRRGASRNAAERRRGD